MPGRDEFFEFTRFAEVRREDLGRKRLAFVRRPTVADAWLLNVDVAQLGLQRAWRQVAVAHDQLSILLVAEVLACLDVSLGLLLDRLGQELGSAAFEDLREQARRGLGLEGWMEG